MMKFRMEETIFFNRWKVYWVRRKDDLVPNRANISETWVATFRLKEEAEEYIRAKTKTQIWDHPINIRSDGWRTWEVS